MADIIVAKRLIDYVGLGVKGIPEGYQRLFKDVAVVLALNEVMGSDGAQLMQGDVSGGLKISIWGGLGNPPLAPFSPVEVRPANADTYGYQNDAKLAVQAGIDLYYDVTTNAIRLRSANAASLSATSGVGAALIDPSGEWSGTSIPATGSQATITRAAGGAGVRHICKSISAAISASVAPVATQINVALRDGISGAGTILWAMQFMVAAAVIAPTFIQLSNLNIVGSAATAMTLEFNLGLANLQESTAMTGYDAS